MFSKQHDELISARSKNLNSEADKEIDFFNAETKRQEVMGKIDPVSMQIIVRQQLQELLQTPDIGKVIMAHLMQDNQIAQQAGLAPLQQGNQTNG
jgi:predicted component of type VI protein secretion system